MGRGTNILRYVVRYAAGRGWWAKALTVGLSTLAMLVVVQPAEAEPLDAALADFARSYEDRLGPGGFARAELPGCGAVWHHTSAALAAPATGPLVLDHGAPARDVVVLFHGLSDSPFFLCAVARELHAAGANVVLPLLTGHGLAQPLPDAHGDDLSSRWMADAEAALDFAATRGARVSAGGLSTGGVLAVWLWTQKPETVDGGLFLFSAAFDFATRLKLAAGCAGTTAERQRSVLRRWCYGALSGWARRGERDGAWRWQNTFRQRLSEYGALHLGILRRATLQALAERPLTAPVFIAHSVADTIAPIGGVDALVADRAGRGEVVRVTVDDTRRANCRELASDCITPAPVATACGIPHASLVLADPVRPDGAAEGPVCEPANPQFAPMIAQAKAFLATLR